MLWVQLLRWLWCMYCCLCCMCVCCESVSLDYLCIWQVQVSVYCAWWIPAHLRCTQCSILLHLMDICFGHVFVYGRYHKSRLVCLNGRHAKKTGNRAPIARGGKVRHNLYSSLSPLWQFHRLYAVSFGASHHGIQVPQIREVLCWRAWCLARISVF